VILLYINTVFYIINECAPPVSHGRRKSVADGEGAGERGCEAGGRQGGEGATALRLAGRHLQYFRLVGGTIA
jgi:hypothetical protein